MSFHIRKLCPSPGKLKQATLSISVNKIDSLLPLSKVDSIFLLGLSPETITVAIFFFFSKITLRTETSLKNRCVVMIPASLAESARQPLHSTELCQSCPLPLPHLPLCHTRSCKSEGRGFSQKPCQVQLLVPLVTSQRTLHKTHKHQNSILPAVSDKPDVAILPIRKYDDKIRINSFQMKLNMIPGVCFKMYGNIFGYSN